LDYSVSNHQSSIVNHKFRGAFTMVELLVVLAILGIIAGLALPALKNFGRADAMTAATAQLIGDVGRARQLAISQRTTVYMVFVPANFWQGATGTFPNNWWTSLNAVQQNVATNLCDRQLTGYTFMAYGAVGDQPGNHLWHYLAPWQSLPEGTFIPLYKFIGATPIVVSVSGTPISISAFYYTNNIPFPTENNTAATTPAPGLPWLPYIAFNYLGQLTFDGQTPANRHEYIPLAKGNVLAAVNPNTRTFQFAAPQILPQGTTNALNWTNAYDIIDIDPLTGRATLKQPILK
jgi:prepilin-type N-terminal cleavage/methylation domain-containing protein